MKKYGIRCLIIILSVFFCSFFISQKEGYHMDEILAFELANAQYNPWIVPTQPQGRLAKFHEEYLAGDSLVEEITNVLTIAKDTLEHKGDSIIAQYKADVYDAPVWIENKTFQDYVRVDEQDDFSFASVYFNVKDDNHPPLHFMLIHLISSLVKGEISAWQGCLINVLAMTGVLWCIGLIGDLIFKNRATTYAAMILFGFSTAIVATSLWIRMYGLLTFWVVLTLYLHLRVYQSHKKMRPILYVTVLAFWTQYFALFFILPLALVMVVALYRSQRMKAMTRYIKTMIGAAILGVLVYPFAIGDVLFSSRGQEALAQWEHGFIEYLHRLSSFFTILAENIFVHEALLAVVLLVGICLTVGKRFSLDTMKIMCMLPTLVYFLLAAKMSPYFVDRYIMAIFPVMVCIILLILESLCGNLKYYTVGIITAMCCVTMVSTVSVAGQYPYLYAGYEDQLEIARIDQDLPLVCLYEGYGFYENLLEMELYEQTMLVKPGELELMDEARKSVTQDGYMLLIKYPGEEHGKAALSQVLEVFGGKQAELVFSESCHGDVIYRISN